jgi:hypothetical protein
VARAWLHVFDTEITEESRGALEVKQELGYDALGVMEKHLEGRQFFVGGVTRLRTSPSTPTPTSRRRGLRS